MKYPLHYPLVLLAVLAAGCDSSPRGGGPARVSPPRLDEAERLQQDDLNLGLDFLNQVYDPGRYYVDPQNPGAPAQVDRLALYHLNQWLAREAKQPDAWKPTPLLQYVPKSLAAIQPLQELDRTRLTVDDMHFLHGRVWQRDIARRVSEQPLPEVWAQWLDENPNGLAKEDAQQLGAAMQLFDWTIRNVQLDPFPAVEEQTVGTASDDQSASALPPQRGVPGPGYRRYPYQTLLFGHGDAYERARVFVELCRQQGIGTALLAVEPASGAVRPWAVAALIGTELFLFDAELGLPIPAEKQRGVATLAALVKQSELLKQMDVDAKQTYWVQPEDLNSLRVWLSASPEELSKRMWLLDRQTSGANHLALYADVDATAARVAASPALKGAQVSLWRVPFEASLYVSLGLGLRLARDQEFAQGYENETFFLNMPMSPIRQARQLQFQGAFDTTQEAETRRRQRERDKMADPFPRDGGAVELYLMTRPQGRAIEDLAYSQYWQRFYGLALPPDPEQRRAMLEMVTTRMQRTRDDVSFWLGLVQYEKGDYENAITWLKQSLPDDSSDKPWEGGGRYNLARSYEALGQTEEAIKLYRSDNSPQKYGNRLRAKWLSRQADQPAGE